MRNVQVIFVDFYSAGKRKESLLEHLILFIRLFKWINSDCRLWVEGLERGDMSCFLNGPSAFIRGFQMGFLGSLEFLGRGLLRWRWIIIDQTSWKLACPLFLTFCAVQNELHRSAHWTPWIVNPILNLKHNDSQLNWIWHFFITDVFAYVCGCAILEICRGFRMVNGK